MSEETGVHVIATTGFNKHIYYPNWVEEKSTEEISDILADDILEGRDGIRAGFIKIGTYYNMIHPLEEKTAVAAAQAQKRCGAPIWGHTEAGTMGMELLDILARENVDFSTVALGHLDRNPDEYYLLKLADRGIYIQFDGPGKVKYYPDSIRVKKKEEIDVLSDMGVPYILTPGFDEQIVRYALEKKIEVLPGVLTPSEVQAAVNCGIHLAKLFPADAFSDRYIKALKGPFPEMDYVAVGGVTPENAVNFYRLGYKGVAAGSNLVPKHAKRSDLKKIRETARKYVEVSQI